MAREHRVRVSDEERELVKMVRKEKFPGAAEEVPLGATIGEMAEDWLESNTGGDDGAE
jgi:hypothetical protein